VVGEHRHSEYQSDAEPTVRKQHLLSADVVYESDTAVLNRTASFSGLKHMPFPGTGAPIGEVNWFKQEISILCDDPYAQCPIWQGLRLASWLLESDVAKSRMK